MKKFSSIQIVSLFACACLLSACTSLLDTRITTFTDKSATAEKGSVYIRPMDETKEGSLEFSWFADPVAKKLQSLGFQVVDNPKADFVLELSYGVNRREADDRDGGSVYISSGFGRFRSGTGVGMVLNTKNDKDFEFERLIHLRLKKTGSGSTEDKSLVEVSAVSVGRCDLILPVYPGMLDAIFQDFYRANGSTVRVKSSLDASHCKVP